MVFNSFCWAIGGPKRRNPNNPVKTISRLYEALLLYNEQMRPNPLYPDINCMGRGVTPSTRNPKYCSDWLTDSPGWWLVIFDVSQARGGRDAICVITNSDSVNLAKVENKWGGSSNNCVCPAASCRDIYLVFMEESPQGLDRGRGI